jgi:hypothetical protein
VISTELEGLLAECFQRARAKLQSFVTVEHLLVALVDAESLRQFWHDFDLDTAALKTQLTDHIDQNTPKLPENCDVAPTLGFQRVLQRAIFHVQAAGKKTVEALDALVAVFSEKQSHAVYTLLKFDVTRLEVVNYRNHGLKPDRRWSASNGQGSEQEFRDDLAEIENADVRVRSVATAAPKLFVSYCHVDKAVLDRLLVHLKPLERAKLLSCWSDTRIRVGDKWREEIKQNIADADIAILLVSADFLASDFIAANELPPLLVAAEARGLRVLPVILKPCGFLRDRVLSSFQAVNDPAIPMLGLTHIEQEAVYDRIANEVAAELRIRKIEVP